MVRRLRGGGRSRGKRAPEPPPRSLPRDPTCGGFVSPEVSHRLQIEGETLHFCSPECRERYREARKDGRKEKPGT